MNHHEPIDQYGDYIWVDTSFPSCAQMIAYFFSQFKDLKLSKEGARALYTGIVTDTGRFRYRGVTELTHVLAGMLISYGADISEIDLALSEESLDMLRYKGYVYQNFITDNGFVYLKITNKLIKEFNISYEDAGSIVNLLGGIKGYPIWAIFLEEPEGDEVRVRLRSNGPDIDKLANKFRGGGHKMASGATLSSWDELPLFIKEVHKLLK